jgi:hypothetical protein
MKEQSITEKAQNHSKKAHPEGKRAKYIERKTAQLSSDWFLWISVGAMTASAILEITGNHKKSAFIGRWASPLLTLGVYNKLVKLMGSEQ